MVLTDKKCVPCEGGVPAMRKEEMARYKKELDEAWRVVGDKKLVREFAFGGFPEAIAFVDRVAVLAEEEGHHPDVHIHYRKVVIELWTHAVGGLSENDFILAAKIDRFSGEK